MGLYKLILKMDSQEQYYENLKKTVGFNVDF